MKIIKSATLNEIDAKEVYVEATFTKCITIKSIINYSFLYIYFIKVINKYKVNYNLL